MLELKGRVAVVTGAASGIGRALAECFASEGMSLVLADIDSGKLNDFASTIQRSNAKLVVPTDVARAEEVQALADRTLAEFGAVHVLCNNAGVGGDFVWTWDQTPETWQHVLGINLWGVIHGIRTFLPHMLRQNTEGHIVNTASLAGLASMPFVAPYHASKHAVVTLSESLHYELVMLKAKVKVSVLCPGAVQTAIMNSTQGRRCDLPQNFSSQELEPQAWQLAYQKMLACGCAPMEIARAVLRAIREEQFYILPNPELVPLVQTRMETILERRNPELALPPEMVALINDARSQLAASPPARQ